MNKFTKPAVKSVLLHFPTICFVLFSVSFVCCVISTNQDVKWNEYYAEIYPDTNIYTFYFNTLWYSVDAKQYEGAKGTGTYHSILKLFRDDNWMVPTQQGLKLAIGFTASSLTFLVLATAIHAVTRQKLFVIIAKSIACVFGIVGGYFSIRSALIYKNSIIEGILDSAKIPIDQGGYYFPENEVMKLGYYLAQYSGITTIAASSVILIDCGIYLIYGDGKWIWKTERQFSPSCKTDDSIDFTKVEYLPHKDGDGEAYQKKI